MFKRRRGSFKAWAALLACAAATNVAVAASAAAAVAWHRSYAVGDHWHFATAHHFFNAAFAHGKWTVTFPMWTKFGPEDERGRPRPDWLYVQHDLEFCRIDVAEFEPGHSVVIGSFGVGAVQYQPGYHHMMGPYWVLVVLPACAAVVSVRRYAGLYRQRLRVACGRCAGVVGTTCGPRPAGARSAATRREGDLWRIGSRRGLEPTRPGDDDKRGSPVRSTKRFWRS